MGPKLTGRLRTGGFFVLLGGVLLLATTGVIAMESIWGWIAAVFVLFGLWGLVRSNFRNLVGPIMIIAVAGTFLLQNLGYISRGGIGRWWPAYIVLFGVLIILNRSRRRHRSKTESSTDESEVSVVSVFGSDDRRVQTDAFVGGDVVAIFGDAELDLRETTPIPRGGEIEVVSVFGDATLRIPSDWDVRLETLTIFGDTTDRRHRPTDGTAPQADASVVVTGVCVFGDIQIRD